MSVGRDCDWCWWREGARCYSDGAKKTRDSAGVFGEPLADVYPRCGGAWRKTKFEVLSQVIPPEKLAFIRLKMDEARNTKGGKQ